jgi:hypothetical protein
MEQEPWQFYFEKFSARAERMPQQAFGRSELLFEAAHDAYQTTTNHLTETGWGDEDALTVTRMFGEVVKQWVTRGETNLDGLRTELRDQYAEWRS